MAIAPDDAWAVGNSLLTKTLAAHWNGKRWRIVPTPSLDDGASPLNTLTGATATGADDVWASGYEANVDDQNFQKPYMLHWDGSAWTLTETPNLGGEGSRLNAMAALAPDEVWAVGQRQELNGGIFTFTQRFDGASWLTVPSPSPHGAGQLSIDSLRALTASEGVLIAGGARSMAGECCLRTLALTRNG